MEVQAQAARQMKVQVAELKRAYARERHSAEHLAEAVFRTSRQGLDFADKWARSNCWKLLGIVLGLGFLGGGWLIGECLLHRSRRPKLDRFPR